MGLAEDTSPASYAARNTLDGRMQAAAQLLVTVRDELVAVTPSTASDELARRRLAVLAASLATLINDVRHVLDAKRRALHPLACPHCAWTHLSALFGTCPRCGKARGAVDAADAR